MANVFNANPMVLDTAFATNAIPAALTAQANGGPQVFRRIMWMGATTAGHVCEFQDVNNNVILSATAGSTPSGPIILWDEDSGKKFPQSKWALPTLGSGKVYLYK